MKKGTLIQNGVHLKEHEYQTVKLLLEQGYDIELIPTSKIPKLRMPDIMMLGKPWEMKSPQGDGKRTIMNTMQNAVHQSTNIIVDLRRCKIKDGQAIKELQRQFKLSKRIRHLIIITKEEKLLDYSK